MSKEKFELVFLAGGAMLDVLGNRLRRRPGTPREAVGATVHEVGRLPDEQREQVPEAEAAGRQLAAIRTELTQPRPNRLALSGYVTELAALVPGDTELGTAVRDLRTAVNS